MANLVDKVIYHKCGILSKYDKLVVDVIAIDKFDVYTDNHSGDRALNLRFTHSGKLFSNVAIFIDPKESDIENARFIRSITKSKRGLVNFEMYDLFKDCLNVLSGEHHGVKDYDGDIELYMITLIFKLNNEKFHPYSILASLLRVMATGKIYGGLPELMYMVRMYIESCKSVKLLPENFSGEFSIAYGTLFDQIVPPNTHPLHFDFRYNVLRVINTVDVEPWNPRFNSRDVTQIKKYISAMLTDISSSSDSIVNDIIKEHSEELYYYPLITIPMNVREKLYGCGGDIMDIIQKHGSMLVTKYNAVRISEIMANDVGMRSSYLAEKNVYVCKNMIELHRSGKDTTGMLSLSLSLYASITKSQYELQKRRTECADISMGYLWYNALIGRRMEYVKVGDADMVDVSYIEPYFEKEDILKMEHICGNLSEDINTWNIDKDIIISCIKAAITKSDVSIYGNSKKIMEFILKQI